jgi:hypothetical protein
LGGTGGQHQCGVHHAQHDQASERGPQGRRVATVPYGLF